MLRLYFVRGKVEFVGHPQHHRELENGHEIVTIEGDAATSTTRTTTATAEAVRVPLHGTLASGGLWSIAGGLRRVTGDTEVVLV